MNSKKPELIVIGNGMAPGRMLEHLLEQDPDKYRITIFNAEPRVNYNRLMLSPVLSGEKSYEDIITHDDDWYAKRNIVLHKSVRVTEIDRRKKTITTESGDGHNYDKLVIATGSDPFIIPIEGKDLDGVITYRDLDDVDRMIRTAGQRENAVVIGGGLLGLEAAAGLRSRGMDVTVIHLCPTLMERQLDDAAGELLKQALIERGITINTAANTTRILGDDGKVSGVLLEDGREIEAAMVVMAVGIKPSSWLAEAAGLDVNRGVVVTDEMVTSDPDIYALGECVEHRGMCYGLVAPLYEMAEVLARNLCNQYMTYTGSVTATKLKVTGIDLYSAGDFATADDREEVILRDEAASCYKRLVIKNDRIIGAVLYGDTSDGPWFFDLLRKQTDISNMRDSLIFGQAYQGGATADPVAAVAALADDAEICGCNGVCKSTITDAITEKSLTTLEEVRAHTKASSSCGTCTGLVEQLMTLALGDQYSPAAVTPMCGCIDLGHDDVRKLIRARQLKTIPSVLQSLGWKTADGCAKCRPALNYYLVCDWPEEYRDHYQSRYINERVHANIQKDGTYSVVPRMWGGVTSANELRAIADVVDKFNIPSVKVTGGQRIDMLGVEKEDLPKVWKDLGDAGFVSGHAYAKGVRTVKTCVGTDWCRFGTRDSTGLGVRIEKFIWGAWTPAKVKMAVSGCPRNCAEATCKDVGVICVDSGYEIHFAGAAGLEIKGTEVLGMVKTEDQVIEYIAALIQMYREQGHYLERIYKWASRVGIEEVRNQIMRQPEKRQEYYSRFVASQKLAQVDPWSERTAGKDQHEFAPLASRTIAVA